MRLHEVTIRNFRGIVDRTVSFCGADGEPRPCTVLVGPNGSGKTTVLDAIHLAYAAVENAKNPDFRPGFHPNDAELRPDPSKPIHVGVVFSLHDGEWETLDSLEKALGGSGLMTEKKRHYTLAIEWPAKNQNHVAVTECNPPLANLAFRGRALAKVAKANRLVAEGVFEHVGGLLYLPQRRFLKVRGPSTSTGSPDHLRERASETDVLPWLELQYRLHVTWDTKTQGESQWARTQRTFGSLASPVAMARVTPQDEGFYLRFTRGETTYSHVGLSSGEEQLLRLAVNLTAYRAIRGVVLLDEIELNLHPRWQRNVLHFCREGGGAENQFIVTTHSESVLEYVRPEDVIVLGDLA